MATHCVCGNHLSDSPPVKATTTPCKCAEPGPGKRQLGVVYGIPDFVFAKQHEERTRLGLPLQTDMEKGIRTKWQ